ncbi:hypothetical protein [Hymenobacter psychrophilus]|uniref:Pentapeptide MXKDX repeat protein n=1 Tax=Hymenobacter psychrophilus TaxID=651662 RepID=A0A1H3LN07_9BACT|nr:hypothetical protein [Hymenobacter psychrophilus]SDY65358.1 hypothetical protein SAMN04488069_11143 [Hymenobacter psychrophilus]
MKNVLLALALFAFTASAATASEGDKGKKAKKTTATTETKANCDMAGSMSTAGTPSCCMKKDAKTSTAATTPAAKPAGKSL